MSSAVPKLVPRRPGRTIQFLGLIAPGLRRVTSKIPDYTAYWDAQNQAAATTDGPLLVVVGDSTGISSGASAPERGWVGRLRLLLEAHDGRPWRVVQLGLSGSRLQDAIDRQIPILDSLDHHAVACSVGTNDLVWTRDVARLRHRIRALAGALPAGTAIATLAGQTTRTRLANRALRNAAEANDLVVVDPWREPGPPMSRRVSSDWFHPNDLGYELMARSFARALGVPDEVEIPSGL
ncbi:MAG: SGNH/GDSL hydrolase family protein [Actinomycetota bacterium]